MLRESPAFRLADPRAAAVDALLRDLGSHFRLPSDPVLVTSLLTGLWDSFGGFEKIRGARILDIGCGGNGSLESRHNRDISGASVFEPWLCRSITLLGGEAVGIDLYARPEDSFALHRIDLTRRDALAFLQDGSFDAVNMRLFLSSPQLELSTTPEERTSLGARLTIERDRLLIPGGRTIFWDRQIT